MSVLIYIVLSHNEEQYTLGLLLLLLIIVLYYIIWESFIIAKAVQHEDTWIYSNDY